MHGFTKGKSLWACLFGFSTSLSTTRLYRGRAPRQSVWQFSVLPHMRQSWETMTSVSAGHIILTLTQPVGSGWPQRESNPGPPHQESCALPTELLRPPLYEPSNDVIGHQRECPAHRKKWVERLLSFQCSDLMNLTKDLNLWGRRTYTGSAAAFTRSELPV